MRSQRVGAAGGVEYHRGLVTAPASIQFEGVAGFVAQACRLHFVALGGTDPAFFRQHHRNRVGAHQFQLAERTCLVAALERRATLITVLLCGRLQLFANQGFQAGVAAQNELQ